MGWGKIRNVFQGDQMGEQTNQDPKTNGTKIVKGAVRQRKKKNESVRQRKKKNESVRQ